MQNAEKTKKNILEWRAQFSQLTEVPVRREKSEQHRIKVNLVRIVHTEENEGKV